MRFRTRAFLLCFLPFVALLATSFWIVQQFVQATVREELHNSLRKSQLAMAAAHEARDLANSRFLKVAGENTALKAGIQLVASHPHSDAARRTLEDQLRELGEHMGFDFMLVSSPGGAPLAAVARGAGKSSDELVPVDPAGISSGHSELLSIDGSIIQVASVPVDENDENIGILTVGQRFDLAQQGPSVVLLRDGKVVSSKIPDAAASDLERAIASCGSQTECDLRLENAHWISLLMRSYGGGYQLLSLDNVDEASAPFRARIQRLFVTLTIIFVLVALMSSIGASRSIVKPIATVVSHLRNAVGTGKLAEIASRPSSIAEIQDLAEIYNRAAHSVRAAGENLQAAYLEFVGTLANALDARDPYTAGHSRRVSDYSCAVARAMRMAPAVVERIRIGALLHDIGKIGVSDTVLQKPGPLTVEEFELVKQHPVIGRRILEGVQGFAEFLPAVELHHENWNGTGYPKGQRGLETPIDARIIHVSDAYDAMTTNRAYRRGMTHEKAISILIEYAGIEFDPEIVEKFVALPREFLAHGVAEQHAPEPCAAE